MFKVTFSKGSRFNTPYQHLIYDEDGGYVIYGVTALALDRPDVYFLAVTHDGGQEHGMWVTNAAILAVGLDNSPTE